jgi:ribose transport system ATP-binding protein
MTTHSFLSMSGISKRFPGVVALDSVQLAVDGGEVVGLVGENGAGKSTLMKILAGIHQPDVGEIRIQGTPITIHSPREATRLGIAIIHQELELIDTLDIAGNVFLGREPVWGGPVRLIDRKKMHSETETWLSRVGLDLSPRTPLARLSTAQRQLVEIAKALSLDARLLIMDEPTSSLTLKETERLFEVIRELRRQEVGVIYISHRLSEIEVIADRVVVLRDGRNAGELARSDIHHEQMIQLMVGRMGTEASVPLPAVQEVGTNASVPIRFKAKGIRTRRYPQAEVSLELRRGEILGLAGLVGAGRSELAQAIFGIEQRLTGNLSLDEAALTIRSPQDAIHHGIYLVPEDRRACGLIAEMSIRENITLPALARYSSAGLIQKRTERRTAERMSSEMGIKAPSVETAASNLSGGNQQKVVLAKWLSLNPKVILFDEPTRGIDVGAKAEIYRLMRNLTATGVSLLMISSDMEEILGNSDRVAVMHEGRITGVLDRSECSQEAIMRLAVT